MEVKIKITDQQIAEVLCSGMEGGTGYWAEIQDDKYVKPKTLKFRIIKGEVFEHIDYVMNGGVMVLKDIETGQKLKVPSAAYKLFGQAKPQE